MKKKLILHLNNLSLIVASAGLAYSVRQHQGAALRALYQVGSAHLPVRSAAVSSRLRGFILRTDRHGSHLLNHLVCNSLFWLVRFGSLGDIIQRYFALTFTKLDFYVDMSIRFFVGKQYYRLHMHCNIDLILYGKNFCFISIQKYLMALTNF